MKDNFERLTARCLLIIQAISGAGLAQDDRSRAHTLTGEFRTHKRFHSSFLSKDRDIIVYLPPGYETNKNKRYPVLYLHDGQNVFDGATSFIPGKEWRVDETAQSLILSGEIEPLIIVGIYNAGDQRAHEYTPKQDARYKVGGKADLYGRMIVEELKPFIDASYRTLKGARHTGLGGSSLGGLVTLYLGLKHPRVFGRLAVVSPSVWWADREIIRVVQSLSKKTSQRIWVDMGTKEGGPADSQKAVKDAEALRDALTAKGWRDGKDLMFMIAEGAAHDETAWAARVGAILKFLYPKK